MKRITVWFMVMMLSVSIAACGGATNNTEQSETLNTENQEKAKRLAEIDRSIADAVRKEDYDTALSMKEEMLALSDELNLSHEYSIIAQKLDEVAAKESTSGQSAGTPADPEQKETVAETPDPSKSASEMMRLGDAIKTGFVEISLDSFSFTENVQKTVKNDESSVAWVGIFPTPL